ncbi:hypothetical protein ACFP2T_20810 [Plantactinospora solaniradicis]|uniref:Zinc ribbon domain-containing protein n=1 Tax=Plantactinospora solaniradicis TaxID=1723736 RepID=A0ABW1K9W6_9ACTN
MVTLSRRYRYIGPAEILAGITPDDAGTPITAPRDFAGWVSTVPAPDLAEPFTFVVDLDGVLRLAPRRSEHVACAAGRDVLGAGEIAFVRQPPDEAGAGRLGWRVDEVSNQSTGYCPDLDSWPAVAAALDRAGLAHPDGFTAGFVFRRCPDCHQCNVVRDDDFVCALCGADLPERWNLDSG